MGGGAGGEEGGGGGEEKRGGGGEERGWRGDEGYSMNHGATTMSGVSLCYSIILPADAGAITSRRDTFLLLALRLPMLPRTR